MQKFRYILRHNFLARFFVHLFVYNFFTSQCLAMIPSEVLLESAHSVHVGMKELFGKYEDVDESIGIALNQQDDRFTFNLEVTKTDIFGAKETKTLSSILNTGNSGEFIDFGYGLNFSLLDGVLNLGESFCNYFGYFKSNTDVKISDFYVKNTFSIAANKITVEKSLMSDFNLTLLARSIENHGIISSPILSMKADDDILNSGAITGQTVSLVGTNVTNCKEGFMTSSGSLDIHARKKLLCDEASIRAKKFTVNAAKFHIANMSHIKSDGAFDFKGDEISCTDSTLLSEDKLSIFARYVKNVASDISARNTLDILTNIFQNDGHVKARIVNAYSFLELINFKSISDCSEIKEYEYIKHDKRLGCIANLGTLQADEIYLTAENQLLNQKNIIASLKMHLSAGGVVANKGEIQQLQYSADLTSSIVGKEGIINKYGIITAKSGLSIVGNFFDNTKGALKARILKTRLAMKSALIEEQSFAENEMETLNSQTENNPYSTQFASYSTAKRSVNSPKSKDASQPDIKSSASADTKDTETRKRLSPEIGYLINTGGTIDADRNIDWKGSGAIYNSEHGVISAKEAINIDVFGRVLNQLGGVISTNSGTIKSAGKIFNTGGSTINGSFAFDSNGFENGIGSSIKGGLSIKSITGVINFGAIHTLVNTLFLSTASIIKNYGSINTEATISIEAKEFTNEAGKIVASAIDARNVSSVFNKKNGLIEAKTGDVKFRDGVTFLNEGRISSNDLMLRKVISGIPEGRYINQGGIIDVRHSLFINSDYQLNNLGIINALQFTFESNAGGTVDLAKLLKDSGVRSQKATFNFPNAKLENKSDTILDFEAQILANEFQNLSTLHSKKDLNICSKKGFINGGDHIFEKSIFYLKSDWDIYNKKELSKVLGGFSVDLAQERKLEKTVISSNGNLTLGSGSSVKNTGTIRSSKRVSFKAPKIQNGWAYESKHHESLPELEFDYDYMGSQPSYIIAEDGMNVESEVFLNTLGIINVNGGLTSTNKGIFLNYGGSIDVRGNAVIASSIFANLIGTINTNREDKRYWSLEFCNTDIPTFNVLGGALAINAPYGINSGGHLFSSGGVMLEGKHTDGLASIIDISSKGLGYNRMFSVNEYNYGQYSDRILGMSFASTGKGAIIRAELNETVRAKTVIASLTGGSKILINDYKDLRATGIIHSGAVHIKTGDGLTELGYTGDAILPSISEFARIVDLFSYVSSISENQVFDIADVGDFFFKSNGNSKIPFTIIDAGKMDISAMKLPFSVDVMEIMLTKQLQSIIGTSYVPDMPTFLDAAKKSTSATIIRKLESSVFRYLEKYTDDQIAIVSSEEAKYGLFFRPQKLGDHWLLFPELHLSPKSVHATLANPAGATVAQGEHDANVIIDTDGFLHATASIHADDDIHIKAARGALFETTTYDAMAVTQNMHATTKSSCCGIDSDTIYYKITEWNQIKKAREPMLVTTTRGDFVIIIPDDKEAVEFKGMFSDIAGNFEVHGGKCVLSPLEIAGVVPCPKIGHVSRISTMLPIFLQTVLKTKQDFYADVRVFKNTSGKIEALGDVVIKATDHIEFNTSMKKFVLADGRTVDEGTFTTKTSSQCVEDVVFAQPTVESNGNIRFETNDISLEGSYKAKRDISIKAEIARLKSVLAYGTHEFKSNASNWLSSAGYTKYATFARIAPTIFQSDGDFIADIMDVYHEHSIQKYCRNELIKAASIDSSPLVANEIAVETRTSKGFDFFIPSAVYAPICDGKFNDAIDAFWRQSALFSSVDSLIHSRRGASIAANGINTALAAYSSISTILSNGVGGAASLFGIGNVGFYNHKTVAKTTHNFTVGSTTIANGNIDWYASTGDIRIKHRMAQAGGDQHYNAAGSIFVNPGEDRSETQQTTTSFGCSFNVFTCDASVTYGRSKDIDKSTVFNPSEFYSDGKNVFRAGNGIGIVIPQISGTRNVFDAMIVKLENKANEHETSHSSSGGGISTNFAKTAEMMASANYGSGHSNDTFLNHAYIEGAVDFMRSCVENQGCCVMDITNSGASYQYVPMEEVHKEQNIAIGLTGLDLSSPNAFAYSLGRSVASAAASLGTGVLASEAGLGGFVSTLASSLAGTYVNTSLMPQRDFSNNPDRKPTVLGSTGTVEFSRNGNGFKGVNVDYEAKELQATIDEVKTRIYGECLDNNVSTEEAVELVEVVEEYVEERYKDDGKAKTEVLEDVKKARPILDTAKKSVEKEATILAKIHKGYYERVKSRVEASEFAKLERGESVSEKTQAIIREEQKKAQFEISRAATNYKLKAPISKQKGIAETIAASSYKIITDMYQKQSQIISADVESINPRKERTLEGFKQNASREGKELARSGSLILHNPGLALSAVGEICVEGGKALVDGACEFWESPEIKALRNNVDKIPGTILSLGAEKIGQIVDTISKKPIKHVVADLRSAVSNILADKVEKIIDTIYERPIEGTFHAAAELLGDVNLAASGVKLAKGAVQSLKITSFFKGKKPWQQSEQYIEHMYRDSMRPQVSYLNGKEVFDKSWQTL